MIFFTGPAGQETGHDSFSRGRPARRQGMIFFSRGRPARRQGMISFAARGPGSAQPASRVALDLVFVSARFDSQMAQNTMNSKAFHHFRGPSCWPSQAGRPAKRESDLDRWRQGMIFFEPAPNKNHALSPCRRGWPARRHSMIFFRGPAKNKSRHGMIFRPK